MAKTRAQKEELVAELDQVFTDSGAVVVCHYAGLTVAEMTALRLRMREAGGSVRVAKNRLARIALEGKDCQGIEKLLTGQTVLAYAEDPVTAAKVVDAYAKDNQKLVILGGAMGAELLDENGVKALAKMPSREEIIAQIAATLTAPASNLSSAIGAPAGNLAGSIKTLAEKDEAEA